LSSLNHLSLSAEQAPVLDNFVDNVEHVGQDIEAGMSELQKAENHQQKFRRKVLIILIIALIIAFIVVFSLYSKLKN
jgi:t-SNARE domain-containing protein 1